MKLKQIVIATTASFVLSIPAFAQTGSSSGSSGSASTSSSGAWSG